MKAELKAAKAHHKAMRPWFKKKRFWLLGIVAVIVIATLAKAGGEDDPSTAADPATGDVGDDEGGSSVDTTPGGQDVYSLGATAHSGDFDITLETVRDPYESGDQFDVPDDGNRFVAVELTIVNTGDDEQTMSTLLGAEVMDSLSRPWNPAFAGVELPQLDGTVPAGDSRRGWIVFEVPGDATGLSLRLKGNLTATGSVFALS